ncbi:hypothetical protein LTR95_014773 [Oleoguttula sp. CCFEE 5521]
MPNSQNATQVKSETQTQMVQELSETNTRLGRSVAKLMDANAKLMKANTKLVESNARLVKRLITTGGDPSESKHAHQSEQVAKLEGRMTELTATAEEEHARSATELSEAFHVQQASESEALGPTSGEDSEIVKPQRVATQDLQKTTNMQYERCQLDYYGIDLTHEHPDGDTIRQALIRAWPRKVAAMMEQKLPKAVMIPFWVGDQTNNPMVHCFNEVDGMCIYLHAIAYRGFCKDGAKSPVDLFVEMMRNHPINDPETWSKNWLGVGKCIEPKRFAETAHASYRPST